MKYTDQELIDELYRVSEEYCDGETPTQRDIDNYGRPSAATYERRFESWNSILEKCNFKINRVEEYDREYLKEYLVEFSEKYCNGETPKRNYFNEKAEMHYSVYENRFGSWNKALKSCGLTVNENHNVTKEELKDEILRLKSMLGQVPTINDVLKYSSYSEASFRTQFGSWNSALEECNLELNFKELTDKEILHEIERVGQEYCDGKAPIRDELQEHGDVCQRTASIRFGSWEDAIEKTDLEPLNPQDYLPTGENHWRWKGGKSVKSYGPSWYSQRKLVLERDGEACRVCDESSKESWIDVHHIKPASEWNIEKEHNEMNSMDNLVCMCRSCHNLFEGQWVECSHSEFVSNCREKLRIEG